MRGYSVTSLRDMRLFYEAWQLLYPNSSAAVDKLQFTDYKGNCNSSVATDEISPTTIGEMQLSPHHIDIYHSILIPDLKCHRVENSSKIQLPRKSRQLNQMGKTS